MRPAIGAKMLVNGMIGLISLMSVKTLFAASYTVTNTSSSASTSGSLPWAIYQANNISHGLDFIYFNIPGSGIHVISLADPLVLTDQVVINGESQPGYSGSPLIVLQGSQFVANAFRLQADSTQGTTSSGSTVQGFWIYDFPISAIAIASTSIGNWIQDNWIGFYISNNVIYKTAQDFADPAYYPIGIRITSSWNTIRNNTLSGLYNGVILGEDLGQTWSGTVYRTNSIQLNKIGTDPTGYASFGNTSDGVVFLAGAKQNFIGPRNTISGNIGSGCSLLHSSNSGNVVFQNVIGTNVAGLEAIQNVQFGVVLANGATGNAVGGPWGGNVISGNVLGGISLGTDAYSNAVGNWIQNNIIGLNSIQTAAIYGQGLGINVQSGATANDIEGNVVSGNNGDGLTFINAQGNGAFNNYVGQSVNGTQFPNGGYGIVFRNGASANWRDGNVFGSNIAGNLGLPGY